jgi:ribosomal protein S18 acetylase RimI-like enzyme
VGTLMITYEVSVQIGGMIHWIQSVYVPAQARRKGVYKSLYKHVCEQAKLDQFVKCVRLYVETENFGAQKTYEAMGMEKMDGYSFEEMDFVFSH